MFTISSWVSFMASWRCMLTLVGLDQLLKFFESCLSWHQTNLNTKWWFSEIINPFVLIEDDASEPHLLLYIFSYVLCQICCLCMLGDKRNFDSFYLCYLFCKHCKNYLCSSDKWTGRGVQSSPKCHLRMHRVLKVTAGKHLKGRVYMFKV